MYVVTFYSFKGGVGRTQALVNTAAFLALRGQRVLVVDFDLEAPGLWEFEGLRLRDVRPGLLDFINSYRMTGGVVPEIQNFVSTAEMDGPAEMPMLQVDVMLAGDRGSYGKLYESTDFQKLYSQQDGWELFEDMRAQWAAYGYDYVLIDSRTGYGEVSGICTLQMADCVAFVSALSEASIRGVIAASRYISDRASLQDQVLIASRIPNQDDEQGEIAWRLEELESGTGLKPLTVHVIESLEILRSGVVTGLAPTSRAFREYLDISWKVSWRNFEDPSVLRVRSRQLSPLARIDGGEILEFRGVANRLQDDSPILLGDSWLRPPSLSVQRDGTELEIGDLEKVSGSDNALSRVLLDSISLELLSTAHRQMSRTNPDSLAEGLELVELRNPEKWVEQKQGLIELHQSPLARADSQQGVENGRPDTHFCVGHLRRSLDQISPSSVMRSLTCIHAFGHKPRVNRGKLLQAVIEAAMVPGLPNRCFSELASIAIALDPNALPKFISIARSNHEQIQDLIWGRSRPRRRVRPKQQHGFTLGAGNILLRSDPGCNAVLGAMNESETICQRNLGDILAAVRAMVFIHGAAETSAKLQCVQFPDSGHEFQLGVGRTQREFAYALKWISTITGRRLALTERTRADANRQLEYLKHNERWNFSNSPKLIGFSEDGPEVEGPDSMFEGALAIGVLALSGEVERVIRVGSQLLESWRSTRWIYPLITDLLLEGRVRGIEWWPMSLLTLRPIPINQLQQEVEYLVTCCRDGIEIQWNQPIDSIGG
jgi:MinD-like ATPase involved in chromosome partitioning or flagellar assembly